MTSIDFIYKIPLFRMERVKTKLPLTKKLNIVKTSQAKGRPPFFNQI